MQQPQHPGKILRSVNASERTPSDPGTYHTNLGLTEWGNSRINGDDEYYWLNRHGGQVTEWFEETKHLSAPASPVGNRWVKCAKRMPVKPENYPFKHDDKNEPFIIFFNPTHDATIVYYFSIGWPVSEVFNAYTPPMYDETWSKDNWIWLEQIAASPVEESVLEMGLQFQNHGDAMTIQCPDEEGEFAIMVKSKGARHWQVYSFDNEEAEEIASFLFRHVANAESKPSPVIEIGELEKWLDAEIEFSLSHWVGRSKSHTHPRKLRATVLQSVKDKIKKLYNGESTAPHPAPAPIVGEREEDQYFFCQHLEYDGRCTSQCDECKLRATGPATAEQAIPEEVGENPFVSDKDWESRKIDRLAEVISMSEDHIRELQGDVARGLAAISRRSEEMIRLRKELSTAHALIKEKQAWIDSHI